jgi:cobalamin biosynthesis protein CobD/CbiB
MRVVRGFTGLLAGGLVALVLALGVAWVIADAEGAPGPGPVRMVGHLVAAVVAVAAQRYADRHHDGRGAVAALVVLAVTVAVLLIAWVP